MLWFRLDRKITLINHTCLHWGRGAGRSHVLHTMVVGQLTAHPGEDGFFIPIRATSGGPSLFPTLPNVPQKWCTVTVLTPTLAFMEHICPRQAPSVRFPPKSANRNKMSAVLRVTAAIALPISNNITTGFLESLELWGYFYMCLFLGLRNGTSCLSSWCTAGTLSQTRVKLRQG